MSPSRTPNGHPSKGGFEEYQALGCELLNSMMVYSHHLRQEGLDAPSISPESLENLQLGSQEGLQAQLRVAEIAQKVLSMTMDPELGLLINSLQFVFCSCLKMAVDLRIGDYISKDQTISAGKLATALGVDPTLLVRIMRVLMTKHVFKEPQPGFYSHTAMSWIMQKPNMQDLLLHRLDDSFRSASRQPDALRLNGYQNPLPCGINGFNLAFDTKGTFWDYVHEPNSERGARFNRAMKAVNINRLADIPLLYPFASLAEHGGLIIDVGGGLGQVGREILLHNPDAGLHCVVQDLLVDPAIDNKTKAYTNGNMEINSNHTDMQIPEFGQAIHSMVENVLVNPVIDNNEGTYTNGNIEGSSSHNGLHNSEPGLHSNILVEPELHNGEKTHLNGNAKSGSNGHEADLAITMQHHNFFDPQPIKGAAAYFFRHIFHDWPDNDCVTILRQTASAMDVERSRILICDQLMLDTSPSTASILYDLDMMALFGGKERNMMEVHTLMKEANERLYISDIRTSPKSSTTIIEVRLAPAGDLEALCQRYCLCSNPVGAGETNGSRENST